LRQQLAIMKQKNKRPKIRIRDRIFWVFLSRFWKDWKSVLIVVKPATVINWHRKGFKLFWAYKSREKGPGRPVDLFQVPTARFQVLYVLVVIWHESRQVVHFNVTGHPTGMWAAQQIVEACPWDTLPKYLPRDLYYPWDTIRKQAGIPDVRIHDLRYNFFFMRQHCFVDRVLAFG
jgi:putative transposase